MVDFEQEIKVIHYKTIEIQPGTYFAEDTDGDGYEVYYRFDVREEEYDYLKVKCRNWETIIIKRMNEYCPTWAMQEIFTGGKGTRMIEQAEFDKVYEAAKNSLL